MEKIEIQKLTLNDIDQLQKIGRQTFYETFSESNSEENMKSYLESGFSVDKIETELNDKNAEFYFAKIDEKIIGYFKVNFVQSFGGTSVLGLFFLKRLSLFNQAYKK